MKSIFRLNLLYSGIMDPSRPAAIFERTKSLYRILAEAQLRKKLRLPNRKPHKKSVIQMEL